MINENESVLYQKLIRSYDQRLFMEACFIAMGFSQVYADVVDSKIRILTVLMALSTMGIIYYHVKFRKAVKELKNSYTQHFIDGV